MRFRKTQILLRDKRFSSLKPVLNSWFKVLRDYTRRVETIYEDPKDRDFPWWYRERPQVGFLAIASWCAGWAVLEEWGMKKRSGRSHSQGRNDLWIGSGKDEWFIEAKHTWCDIHRCNSETMIRTIQKALTYAADSARKPSCTSSKKIGALFVSPVWKSSKTFSPDQFNKAQTEWIRTCKSITIQADVVALYSYSKHDECPLGEKGELYFGSALFLVGL